MSIEDSAEFQARLARHISRVQEMATIGRELRALFPNASDQQILMQARDIWMLENQNAPAAAAARRSWLSRLFGR